RARAQEPARHLRAQFQLVAGCHRRRTQMSALRPLALGVTLAVTASACATRVQVPEIPILDSPAFKAARREPDPKPPVQYVEVPKPLPLPGQLKPLPKREEKLKDETPPKDRIA